LEFVDLSFNYFGGDENIRTLTRLSRLHTMILYGNPILGSPQHADYHLRYLCHVVGPTGEDSLRVYIADLDAECEVFRKGYGLRFLEIVTEIPRRKFK
jgi:hypothetical protein